MQLLKKSQSGKLSLTDGYTIKRLKAIKANIQKTVDQLKEAEKQQLGEVLIEAYQTNYETLRAELPDRAFTTVNKKAVEKALKYPWSGADFSDRIWRDKASLTFALNEILTRGLVQGLGVGELARQIDGKMQSGYKNALRLARTETIHYLNDSALKAYKDSGVKKVQFWAAEDERTCPECGVLHGKEYPIDKAPILPVHPNCRCTYIPVVDLPTENTQDTQNRDIIKQEEQIRQASSIKDANTYAEKILKVPHAGYKGVDIEIANAWNGGLADNLKKFPELLDNFDFVGTCQERNRYIKKKYIETIMPELRARNPGVTEKRLLDFAKQQANKRVPRVSKNVIAQSYRYKIGRGITVNAAVGSAEELVQELRYCVKMKFHPEGCETIRSVLDHEIAHQIDDLIMISGRPEVIDLFQSLKGPKMTEALSEYAWKNSNKDPVREFVAEAWAEYCNNPTPRPVAKRIGEIIEEVYSEWKKK
ncbi:minor capsid protein [Neobittarella massiliensis]|uniref:Minor capsid protein n=1 Tax=Neobittarella massiliensis (ex Bilen et al. 2018) TaxID=2041842 RepID=A0A8J6INM3_9FIRM|nr:minor capsid protein [Neobittarella massiliensis]MBC3516025.1 minor capsid protein [Neobittarella massiliensis]